MASSGLLIRYSAIPVINGVYLLESSEQDVDKSWIAKDRLCRIRYIEDDHYNETEDPVYTEEVAEKALSYFKRIGDVYTPVDTTSGEISIGMRIDAPYRVEVLYLLTSDTVYTDEIAESGVEFYRRDDRTGAYVLVTDLTIGASLDGLYIRSEEYVKEMGTVYTREMLQNGVEYVRLVNGEPEHMDTYVGDYVGPLYYRVNLSRWAVFRISKVDSEDVETEVLYAISSSSVMPYATQSWIVKESGAADTAISVVRWDDSTLTVRTTETYDEENDVRTVTTSYLNTTTGDKYAETSVVRGKTAVNVNTVERLDYVNLMVGKVYRFQFVSEFASLGYIPSPSPDDYDQPINAGIYRVDKVMSYFDVVATGIDLYVNLYKPCGVTQEVFVEDKKRLADSVVYRLVDPTDESRVYFMPQVFIKGTPDASVMKYNRLLLTIDLGIQPDPDELEKETTVVDGVETVKYVPQDSPSVLGLGDFDSLVETISSVIAKMYGVEVDAATVSKTVYDHIWLTDEAFGHLRKHRENIRKSSTIDLATLFNLEATNRIYRENRVLRGKVATLESIVRKLNGK